MTVQVPMKTLTNISIDITAANSLTHFSPENIKNQTFSGVFRGVKWEHWSEMSGPFNGQCPSHIETSQLICSANQLTDFYVRGTLTVKGLISFFANNNSDRLLETVKLCEIFINHLNLKLEYRALLLSWHTYFKLY